MPVIRILMVDDNACFLKVARRIVESVPTVEVVGSAASGQEAVGAARRLNPDLVLMDLAMPGMNGLDATRHIKAMGTARKVAILSMHGGPDYREAAALAGADEYLCKENFADGLRCLIETVFPDRGEARP